MKSPSTAPPISIGRLNIRVPGSDSSAGHRVAARVTERLADQSSGLRARHIGMMNLRIQAPENSDNEAMAESITAAILRNLNQSDHA